MIQRYNIAVEEQTVARLDSNPEANPEPNWKSLLGASKITTKALLAHLELANHPLADASAESLFELRVPPPYLAKIEKGNPNDPLLLQVLPQAAEQLKATGFVDDPLNEKDYSPLPGLIHKYKSRVLLIATQSCAIHCRYCFRRSFPYNEHRLARQAWQKPLQYIESTPAINEVILSGGDPLILRNDALKDLLAAIDQIPAIKRIRIHSRLVSSLPQRIDDELIDTLRNLRAKVILVTHCNHPNEIDSTVQQATKRLLSAGVTLLNQSVLLKQVNDDPKVLAKLSERLFEANITPYYLFTLDKVTGTQHFELSTSDCRTIYAELLALLPGYLVPKLVSEIPDRPSKSPLDLNII